MQLDDKAAFLWNQFCCSLRSFDDKFCIGAPVEVHCSCHTFSGLIVLGDVVVLVEGKASVRSCIDVDAEFLGIAVGMIDLVSRRDDGACFCEDRERIDIPVHVQDTAASVFPSGEYIIINPIRQPDFYLCHVQLRDARRCDRSGDQLTAEEILIGYMISVFFFGIVIVHGQHQRDIVRICPVVHCVQVRQQPVPQTEEFIHHGADLRLVAPGLLAVEFATA